LKAFILGVVRLKKGGELLQLVNPGIHRGSLAEFAGTGNRMMGLGIKPVESGSGASSLPLWKLRPCGLVERSVGPGSPPPGNSRRFLDTRPSSAPPEASVSN
jgi:hypothetical protein